MKEAFLELAGGNSAARVDFTALVYPDLGETEHEAAKQTQGESGLGIADSTVVFAQGHIQSVMQTALDDPIATLEFEEGCGIELLDCQTANKVKDLGSLLPLAPDPPPQPRDGLDPGEAHLLRSGLLAI